MSKKTAQKVLKIESDAIKNIIERIGSEFEKAEDLIIGAEGRVIVSGLGKSGIIARKIASTLSSIGVPSFFLHPVEGAHGDIGMVIRGDVAIVLSKSGSTDELTDILNHLKHLGVPIISITGNPASGLASISDVVLDVSVESEACPFNIVPTASTTVALALGDALAMSIFERKGLTEEDFALLHPGGNIGRKITYRVKDLMVSGKDLPLVDIEAPMGDVLNVMSEKKLGIAVITENGKLAGVITDGDLRRLLQRVERPLEVDAKKAMALTTRENMPRMMPITIASDTYAATAVNLMEKHIITSLVVTNDNGEPIGLIRWIDLSLAGVI